MTARNASSSIQFRVATSHAPGAIAVVDVTGDVEFAFERLGIRSVRVGEVALRDLGGIDEGVVVRWSDAHAHLLPHAGSAVLRLLADRFVAIGAAAVNDLDPRVAFPEARDEIDACMLDALSRAESPAAIDLLLAQPARWRNGPECIAAKTATPAMTAALNRLIAAPLVVAIGPPNIGKSTLTNALAREGVSLVADQPGTTRDHVGVSLELPSPAGAVIVHWIDAPGVRAECDADPIEREAIRLARKIAQQADLIVSCADSAHGFLDEQEFLGGVRRETLRVGLRADLGEVHGGAVQTAAAHGRGVAELAARVRQVLVPDEALAWGGRWRFHPQLPPG